jgi:hypothetical protein
MAVKWANVVMLALALIACAVAIGSGKEIAGFLGLMGQLGPSNTPDERYWGLVATGLVFLVVAGLLRAIIESNRRR